VTERRASRSFDDSWETETYSRNKSINKYPFGDLVPYVLRLFAARLRAGERPRALELGSGSGNNLAFLAREGFETHGIEGAASACAAARTLLSREKLAAEIVQADFIRLPYPDASFDLVVDRASVCHNRKPAILEIAREIRRVLKSGGRLLSFAFSTAHGSIALDGGELLEPNTYAGFKDGPFVHAGVTHFFTQEEFSKEYFEGLELEFLYHHSNDLLAPGRRNQYAEFIGCGRKP
jgi:SAM-dependent methyltransferase